MRLDANEEDPVRALLVGWPGAGKTGAVCALLNAGFKVRMIDFEGNFKVIKAFTDPRALPNFDVLTFQDPMSDVQGKYFDVAGIPTAFNNAIKALQDWKTTDAKGNEISLGASSSWGPDTVLVVDGLSTMGEAAFRRARKMMNATPHNKSVRVWGAAVDDQVGFIRITTKMSRKHHTLYLGHLQMIGPKTPMTSEKEDDEIKELKEQIAIEAGQLIKTRLYPRAVTENASTNIAKEFPTMLLAERKTKGNKVNRFITTIAGEELDLKFPVKNAAPEYPIETGLATIFEQLGAKAPGFGGK